jgi:RNA polymerase sigma factor (sigma-70 family)
MTAISNSFGVACSDRAQVHESGEIMEELSSVQVNRESIPESGAAKLDPKWQEQMVLQYAPLIKYIASRLAVRLPSHISMEDLISSGIIGLIDAVQKFDPSKNINFKTYAEFRIKGAMLDELRSLDWIPRSVRKKTHLIEDAYAKLQRNQIDKIDKFEIQRLTKSICKAYKAGYINEELFEELIEYLLAFFIEFTIQEKFANKTSHLNNKLSKLSGWNFIKYESAR